MTVLSWITGKMNWQDTPTSEIVNLRFQFPSTFEVDKGQTVCITFKGTIPDYVQNTGEENIAWNSFAYSYQYLNDKNELVETPMVAEPAKVGVWVPEVKDTVSLVVNKAYDSGIYCGKKIKGYRKIIKISSRNTL